MPRDWDRHYSDGGGLDEPPDALLVEAAEMAPPGEALDLACGAGRHAVYLASLGWRVTAVDNSAVALAALRARSEGLAVKAHRADLENGGFRVAPGAYDLACDFYFLHRELFPQIREGVRPGGLFVAAIHLVDPSAAAGPRHPDFLLAPGELRCVFADWKIAFYSEAPGKAGRRVARLIARRA